MHGTAMSNLLFLLLGCQVLNQHISKRHLRHVFAFMTGMALSKAVKYVREKKSDYRCVEVKYADQVDFFL